MDGFRLAQGHVYRRRDLHDHFGGQTQGGISTPAGRSAILLFTGESGEQHGYTDGWAEDGVFLYTGEGQTGDMQFVRGNLAIRDHALKGKDLHLFEQTKKRFVRYVGQMVCTGFHHQQAPDTNGSPRQAIVFELAPLSAFAAAEGEAGSEIVDSELQTASLQELRQRAMASSVAATTASERIAVVRRRSEAIRQYVRKRANGKCEGCSTPAPFRAANGPYLEPHHVRRLSDGGPDHPRWVIALCPNCHRRAHYSEDAHTYNAQLTAVVGQLEAADPTG